MHSDLHFEPSSSTFCVHHVSLASTVVGPTNVSPLLLLLLLLQVLLLRMLMLPLMAARRRTLPGTSSLQMTTCLS
jgi:hypothetical protein